MFNSICQVPKSLPGLGAGPQLWLEYPVVSQSPNTALECHSHSSAAFSLSSPSSQERLQPPDCHRSAGCPPNPTAIAQLRPLHPLHPHPLGRGAAPTAFPQRRVPSHGLAGHQGTGSTHYPRANPSEPCQGPGNSGCCRWGPSGCSGPAATPVPCQSSWVRRPTRRVLEHPGHPGRWDTRLRAARGWQGGWHSWHSPPGQSCGCCVTGAGTATFTWLLLPVQHPQSRQSRQHPAAPSSTQ